MTRDVYIKALQTCLTASLTNQSSLSNTERTPHVGKVIRILRAVLLALGILDIVAATAVRNASTSEIYARKLRATRTYWGL